MLHVRVRNFQSIRDGTFVIDGFTVVTGTNNLGKSALFRAVKGVFTNPAATFTRHGTKTTTVEISGEDRYVKWEKGPKKSAVYTLKVGENEQVFENVGHKCPDKVLEAFGIGTIQVGNTTLWPQFADQFTGPLFLLDKPGSAIADAVANIERIQMLNRALKACESDKRSAVSDLKLRKKDQESIERDLARFEGLDGLVEQVEKLESDKAKADRIRNGHKKLALLARQYATAKQQAKKLDGFDPQVPDEKPATRLVRELEESRQLRVSLRRSASALEALGKLGDVEASLPPEANVEEVRRLQTGVKRVRQLRARLVPLRGEVEHWKRAADSAHKCQVDGSLEKKARQIQAVVKLLRALRSEISVSKQQVEKCETSLSEVTAEIEEIEEDLGEALGHYDDCPLCGASIEHA